MPSRLWILLAAVAMPDLSSSASANTLFTDLPSPTGAYEWDVFDALGADDPLDYPGPHPPDVRGTSAATIGVTNMVLPDPSGMAPKAQVTSGFDLYSGNSLPTHTVSLTGATAASPQTTLVLQLAVASSSALQSTQLSLGGNAPLEFVDRGVLGNTKYYWAEWQAAASGNYAITFGGHPHFVLRGAQLEYVNSVDVYNATAPGAVPEPATGLWAGASVLGLIAARRRRSVSCFKHETRSACR